jgi:hypothetical protein
VDLFEGSAVPWCSHTVWQLGAWENGVFKARCWEKEEVDGDGSVGMEYPQVRPYPNTSHFLSSIPNTPTIIRLRIPKGHNV